MGIYLLPYLLLSLPSFKSPRSAFMSWRLTGLLMYLSMRESARARERKRAREQERESERDSLLVMCVCIIIIISRSLSLSFSCLLGKFHECLHQGRLFPFFLFSVPIHAGCEAVLNIGLVGMRRQRHNVVALANSVFPLSNVSRSLKKMKKVKK
jgi:hypothetical protein